MQKTRIEKSSSWSLPDFSEVLRYRDLLFLLVWRDLKSRYRQSALGPVWFMLLPLIKVAVFTVIFGKMLKLNSDGIPYPVFAYAALLPWQYFATTTTKTSGSLVMNMHIISKVYFPRILIPLSACTIAVVDFVCSLIVLLIMMAFYNIYPSWHALWAIPLYTALTLCSGLAIGFWLSTIAVKFRDIVMGLGQVLAMLFYVCPIVYSVKEIPETWRQIPLRQIYMLNPMTQVIEGFRWAMCGSGSGPGPELYISFTIVLFFMITGMIIFRRTERSIVDLI